MAAASAPRPRGDRFEIASLVPLVLAALWSVAVLIGAMALPVYASGATLVGVNGVGSLLVVAVPAILVVVVAVALRARHRAQRPGAGAVAWTSVGVLGVFAFISGFSIGVFVVPIVVLLAIACAMTNAPPRPAPGPVTRRSERRDRPSASTWTAIGATAGGALGCVVGLVLGLRANPATAWFAVFEVGIPAAVLGGLVGLVTSAVVSVGRWIDRRL